VDIVHVPICTASAFCCKFINLGSKIVIDMSFVSVESCPLSYNRIALCAETIKWKFKPHDRSLQILIVSFGSIELTNRFLLVGSCCIIIFWDPISIRLRRGEGTHFTMSTPRWLGRRAGSRGHMLCRLFFFGVLYIVVAMVAIRCL
jgi:hypothetical protein